jgi:predicted RNA-binding Zn-ribbon protein involved in translation (DUF1610 family)
MTKPTVVLDCRHGQAMTAVTGPDSFRVIYHQPICPECGSDDIAVQDIELTDDSTETAYVCGSCGEAWPMACVTDWTLTNHDARPVSRHG